ERADIVAVFDVGRNFDELHRALAPVRRGFDPNVRPALEPVPAVLEIAEIPRALQQSEAARPAIGKGRDGDARRVVQGAPELLADPVPDGEALAVVHVRPPIAADEPVDLAVIEHAG